MILNTGSCAQGYLMQILFLRWEEANISWIHPFKMFVLQIGVYTEVPITVGFQFRVVYMSGSGCFRELLNQMCKGTNYKMKCKYLEEMELGLRLGCFQLCICLYWYLKDCYWYWSTCSLHWYLAWEHHPKQCSKWRRGCSAHFPFTLHVLEVQVGRVLPWYFVLVFSLSYCWIRLVACFMSVCDTRCFQKGQLCFSCSKRKTLFQEKATKDLSTKVVT